MTESSIKTNQAISNWIDKLPEIKNDRGIVASYIMSPLSKITNPETTIQFEIVKDSISNRVNEPLIHNTIPITSNVNLLTYRDTGK